MKGLSNLLRVFTDPLIVPDVSWADCVPESLRQAVTVERLILTHEAGYGGMITEACDAEVVAYLMVASLRAPLDSDWTRIYLYMARKYVESKGIECPDFLEEYGGLSEYESGQLKKLKCWIKSTQDKHFKTDRKTSSPVIEVQRGLPEFL